MGGNNEDEVRAMIRGMTVRCPACGEALALREMAAAAPCYPPHNVIREVRQFPGGMIERIDTGRPCPGAGRAVPVATTGAAPRGHRPSAAEVEADTRAMSRAFNGEPGMLEFRGAGVERELVGSDWKLGYTPILPGSVRMATSDGSVVIRDTGTGALVSGAAIAERGPSGTAGTINYQTGAFQLDFVARGQGIVASYEYDMRNPCREVEVVDDLGPGTHRYNVAFIEPEPAPANISTVPVAEAAGPTSPDPEEMEQLVPGQRVWHRTTGEGPWTTIRPAALMAQPTVANGAPSAAGVTRADRVAVEDAWMVDTGTGRGYFIVPSALLTRLAPPPRSVWVLRSIIAVLVALAVAAAVLALRP